ncbi:hypothetical protein HRI_003961000 [Hibiscus trionum]|uniref:Reverse transcriptase domain-containing protein n=1 Tax=Hibiscus trionum TaxID=183268 RepID=A0A9W7MG46_HIBTR|nr:hypothetical protein HRI_003961000 [Hibiscus trionum]
METWLSGDKADRIISRLGFQFSFRVEAQGFCGGIWLLWNGDVTVSVISVSNQFIHTMIQGALLDEPCFLTVVYASPQAQYMRHLWDQLCDLNPGDERPWIIGGDFNALLHLDDRRGGQSGRNYVCRKFQDFVFSCALQEAVFKGSKYTWSRGDLYERLDRFLINAKWADSYPNCMVRHLQRIGSDHRPILLCMESGVPTMNAKVFRYVFAWHGSEGYDDVVEKAWDGSISYANNISKMQADLSIWNSQSFGSLGHRKRRIFARLGGIERALERRHSDHLYELARTLKVELEEILDMEESIWRQKARCEWVIGGDRNTKYYHALVNGRKKRNAIVCLKDDMGKWISDPEVLKRIALDFFAKLFSSEGDNGYTYNCRGFFKGLSMREKSGLDMQVSREEIHHALLQMHPSKAPGVDGFHALFFQRHWDVVGDVVCRYIQHMFSTGLVDPDLNRTLLVLIPKIEAPESIVNFRPISLCTVVYKILSKVLVNRLKPYLPRWVSENQTSFVPGRSITDNVVLAQEIIHSMRQKGGKNGWFAIKVDLEKAYDRLNGPLLMIRLVN